MDLTLEQNDGFRIKVKPQSNNFVDVNYAGYGGQSYTFFKHFCYLELREKDGFARMFSWESKRHKKEADLGWWNDAEVVWACNEIVK